MAKKPLEGWNWLERWTDWGWTPAALWCESRPPSPRLLLLPAVVSAHQINSPWVFHSCTRWTTMKPSNAKKTFFPSDPSASGLNVDLCHVHLILRDRLLALKPEWKELNENCAGVYSCALLSVCLTLPTLILLPLLESLSLCFTLCLCLVSTWCLFLMFTSFRKVIALN